MLKSAYRAHPVLAYFVLVFAISWGSILIAAGPIGLLNSKANPAKLTQFIYVAALAGPSIASLLMTGLLHGNAGLWHLFARVIRWRVAAQWYLVALLTAPFLMTTILFVLSLTSPAFVPAVVTSNDRAGLLLSGIVLGLVVCFFEELGWTGFATPELRRRHGFLSSGIIMGIPWGAWHYPLFSASVSESGTIPPTLYIAVMLFSFLIPFRILMVWLHDRTNSVFLVMLMHAPLAAGMVILLPPAMSGVNLVIFDVTFAAVLWAVVAALYMAARRTELGRSCLSAQASVANAWP